MLWDYRTFARRASAIAAGLRKSAGLTPGDRVAVFMTNSPQYLEILYAIWWAGMVAVPVNAKLHPRELAFVLGDAEASCLFIGDDLASSTIPVIEGNHALRQTLIPGTVDYDALLQSRANIIDAPGAGRSGLVVLHVGHDRQPQRRDSNPSQPAGHDQLLLQRRGSGRAGRRHRLCSSDVARRGPVQLCARPEGHAPRRSGFGRLRPCRALRAGGKGRTVVPLCGAHHGQATGRARGGNGCRPGRVQDDRLWRRSHVRRRHPQGAGGDG